jgi:succinyl-diaminopimelate desuccinylase
MNSSERDPVAVSEALIRHASVTPVDGGALDVLIAYLTPLGFECHDLTFDDPDGEPTRNLYARKGTEGPNFCWAGHTDVVPPGDLADWESDPFSPEIRDGRLYGRGAADMKCAVACMMTATADFLAGAGDDFKGSISFLITGDEEGDATNGTKKVLDWLKGRGETLDACLVGEPTNPEQLSDMVKIGRRGSMNVWLDVEGVQGHSAYPHLADNPIHKMMGLLTSLTDVPLDEGSDHFQPSTLQVTTVDVANAATNVIPARASARVNIRFNDLHTSDSIIQLLKGRLDQAGGGYEMRSRVSGESFLTPPGALSKTVVAAIHETTGKKPELSTTGGTSDARFIKDHCPVVEFGLINQTAHKVNENVRVEDIRALSTIYTRILDGFFGPQR